MSQPPAVPSVAPSLKKKDQRFDSSINVWTLCFHDPETETAFVKTYDESIRFSTLSRMTMLICVGFAIVYRIIAVVCVLLKLNVKTGSLVQETTVLIIQLVVVAIEVALSCFRPRATCRGSFLGVCFPITILYSAFYTQNGPRVSVPYIALY
ncbi:MAG: hypothetical protein P4M11_07860 [Candidatus Pacebacteria bacterium]|nr:hypothetical protein [Candidatus Paceibacterota bacterium]